MQMRNDLRKPLREAGQRLVVCVLLYIVITITSGCIFWTPVVIVAHPNAPAMITEVRRRYYRTAVYSKADNKMLNAGWTRIKAENLVGRTISTYDWEAHIANEGQ